MADTVSSRHPFDDAIALTPLDAGLLRGRTSAHYANMVGPFGGTTCALMLQAVLAHPARSGDPVSLTANYLAPIADGEFDVKVDLVRGSKTVQHWAVTVTQGGEAVATASAVLALRRPTWSATEAEPPVAVDVMPASDLKPFPAIGTPAWVRRYDLRFVPGFEPGTMQGQEREHGRTMVWMRDEPPRTMDFASLAALCDAFFPRVFIRRQKASPAGTVTLTTYFHCDLDELGGVGAAHVLGVARPQIYRQGFFDQQAEIWSADGQLLATTSQMVYFKD